MEWEGGINMMAICEERKSCNEYFDILEIENDSNSCLLLIFKSYTSPIYHLKNEELFSEDFSGEIILDRMLHVGNSKDRFIKYSINNGKLEDDSGIVTIFERKSNVRRSANEMYRKYPKMISSSILNESQKKLLLHGISI